MDEKKICVYHRIMKRENFEVASNDIFQLLVKTQEENPNKPRLLYVDIDGHRNEHGGFDVDMLELQKEFGVGFLAQFFQEVHFPLGSVKNPGKQNNDVPEKLEIMNERNEKGTDLEELYIENYSNTEFMSEEDVYEYLKHFSAFLRDYDEWNCWNKIENSDFDEHGLMLLWQEHLKNLCIELFNNFLHGNLLTAAAMTRTLIECYVYIRVLIEKDDPELLEDWFLASLIKHAEEDKGSKDSRNNIRKQIEAYCNMLGRKYDDEKTRLYKWRQDNKWLSSVIDADYITVKGICKHLKESEMYDDYSYLCSFIHGQDVLSKMQPFLFYSSIYDKLFRMSFYIFKSIRLFEIDDALEIEIQDLEDELYQLGKTYLE